MEFATECKPCMCERCWRERTLKIIVFCMDRMTARDLDIFMGYVEMIAGKRYTEALAKKVEAPNEDR